MGHVTILSFFVCQMSLLCRQFNNHLSLGAPAEVAKAPLHDTSKNYTLTVVLWLKIEIIRKTWASLTILASLWQPFKTVLVNYLESLVINYAITDLKTCTVNHRLIKRKPTLTGGSETKWYFLHVLNRESCNQLHVSCLSSGMENTHAGRVHTFKMCVHTLGQTERYPCLWHTGLNQITGIITDYSVYVFSLFQEGCCLPRLMRAADTAENRSSSPC